MNIWKDVFITAIIASVIAIIGGIILISHLEDKWQDTCTYVPLDQKYKTPCRGE